MSDKRIVAERVEKRVITIARGNVHVTTIEFLVTFYKVLRSNDVELWTQLNVRFPIYLLVKKGRVGNPIEKGTDH